jgi:predicted MPP superfamily phosphohydrolase
MLAKQVLIVCLLLPLIEYYAFVAVRKVLRNLNSGVRMSVWIFYIVLSVSILLGLTAFRYWATSSWPTLFLKFLTNGLIALFFGKFLIFAIMFLSDIVQVFRKIVEYFITWRRQRSNVFTLESNEKKNLLTRSEFVSRGALICGALLASGLEYGTTNKYRYKLRHVQLPLNGFPGEFKGFKIVQISDIHAGSFDNKEAVIKSIEMIMDVKADIILFTGDLVNYRAVEISPYMDIFRKLDAPLGVYAVLGNHDYGDYISWSSEQDKITDFKQLLDFQKAMGWQVLRNTHRILQWKGRDFALIGTENWSTHERFPKYGDLKKAISGLENTDLPLKILMSHDPSHWDALVRPNYRDINLTLSGHTHGMQFGIDVPGVKWSPAQYLYKQWAGLYREKDQYLYVNPGFGFIGYDGRLGILPEITLIEFC